MRLGCELGVPRTQTSPNLGIAARRRGQSVVRSARLRNTSHPCRRVTENTSRRRPAIGCAAASHPSPTKQEQAFSYPNVGNFAFKAPGRPLEAFAISGRPVRPGKPPDTARDSVGSAQAVRASNHRRRCVARERLRDRQWPGWGANSRGDTHDFNSANTDTYVGCRWCWPCDVIRTRCPAHAMSLICGFSDTDDRVRLAARCQPGIVTPPRLPAGRRRQQSAASSPQVRGEAG